MSCIFCNSQFHRSEYCEIIKSDESRKQFLIDNNRCEICILPLVESDQHGWRICYKKRKCYICFFRSHDSVFCPDQSTAPKLFVPKIDGDLVQRFVQTFDQLEQYSIKFSSPPEVLNLFKLKPLKIIKQEHIPSLTNDDNSNIILDGQILLQDLSPQNVSNFFQSLSSSKSMTIRAHSVYLKHFEISPQNFFSLLTPFITMLYIIEINFESEIKFSQILEKVPNIQFLKIEDQLNVMVENSWAEDLLKYKRGNNFETLELQIENFNFNVKALAEFMRKKCSRKAKISLIIPKKVAEDEFKVPQTLISSYGRSVKSDSEQILSKYFEKNCYRNYAAYKTLKCMTKNTDCTETFHLKGTKLLKCDVNGIIL